MNWYYAIDQQRVGPVTDEQFAALVQQGTVTADILVWNESMTEWKRLIEVRPDLLGSTGIGEEMEFCTVSGKAYPRRLMLQYQDKWISAEHRDEFFQRLREGVLTPNGMVYAGFGRRFGAKLIDIVLMWLISAIKSVGLVMIFFGHMNIFVPSANPAENMGKFMLYTVINMLLEICIALAYNWFFLSKFQATPGKMALDMKVVRADGSRLSTGRIIGRYFSEWISGMILAIGYIMAGFDEPEHRALHDRICDTRVIKVSK